MSGSTPKFRCHAVAIHSGFEDKWIHIDVAKRFQDASVSWRASDCRKALQERLKALKLKAGWPIKRAILMAIGNITIAKIGLEDRKIMQLVVFLDIVEMIQEDTNTKIQLLVQDPVLEDEDTSAFKAFGFEILLRPEAEKLVDNETFVMIPFCGFEHPLLSKESSLLPPIFVSLSFEHMLWRSSTAPQAQERPAELLVAAEQYYDSKTLCQCTSRCVYKQERSRFGDLWLHLLKD